MAEVRTERGFSLIEVMVALLLFALAAVALIESGAAATRHARYLEVRMAAGILAENLLVERIATRTAPEIGGEEGMTDLAGHSFRWGVRTLATDAPGLLRLEVDILSAPDGQHLLSLSGFRRRT